MANNKETLTKPKNPEEMLRRAITASWRNVLPDSVHTMMDVGWWIARRSEDLPPGEKRAEARRLAMRAIEAAKAMKWEQCSASTKALRKLCKLTWRNHYVPQFYLEQWTGTDGLLHQYRRLPSGEMMLEKVPPEDTGYEEHLFTFRETAISGQRNPDQLETGLLQEIDGKAAPVLRKLKSGEEQLTDEEGDHWARFIISLIERDPREIQNAKAFMGAMWDEETEAHPDVQEAFPKDVQVHNIALRSLKDAINNRLWIDRLKRFHWRTFAVGQGKLLTSNHPLIVNFGEHHRRNVEAPAEPIRVMSMALCPAAVLVMYSPKAFDFAAHQQVLVNLHNVGLLQEAPTLIYSLDEIPKPGLDLLKLGMTPSEPG